MQLIQLNIKLQKSNKSLFVQNVREERRATEKQRERAQTELAHYGDTGLPLTKLRKTQMTCWKTPRLPLKNPAS